MSLLLAYFRNFLSCFQIGIWWLVLVTAMLFSSMFGKWFSCKSWQDTLICTNWGKVHPIQRFGDFYCFRMYTSIDIEVVLIKIIWGIMAHVLGLFWICSFFCQITFLGFGMDVVANISCYVCVKIPWKNLKHQHFFSFLNKTWFCWEPKHHLCWISWLWAE